MKFDAVRIVLVSTSHPGNIGAAARAMKTMGLKRLYLVNPKIFPDKKAFEMSAGADDVLAGAVVTQSLHEAIEDCQLVLGTSARPRDLALPGLVPASQAELVHEQSHQHEIAIVFGREHAGLTNDELLACHYHINIPSNPDYSSLNLAQAVQIIAYELRMKSLQGSHDMTAQERVELASITDVEQFYTHLQAVLIEIDFLKPSNPKRLLHRLRRLFNRVKLEKTEVNILRGILTSMQSALKLQKDH